MADAPAGMRIADRVEREPVEYDETRHGTDRDEGPAVRDTGIPTEREVHRPLVDDTEEEGLSDADVGVQVDEEEPIVDEGDGSLAERVASKADLSEVWKQHGIEGLPSDPAELLNQWQVRQQAEQRAQELQNQLVWQAHNYNQQQAWQQQQALQAQQAAQAAQQKPIFSLPEFDRAYLDMVTTDENGNLIAKPGADPTTPGKIQAYAKAREQAIDTLLKDPVGTLMPGLIPQMEQRFEQKLQQRMQAYHRNQELRSFEKENAHWVFEGGKYRTDGKVTPAAQVFNRYYQEAERLGYADPIAYAQRGLDAEVLPHVLEQQREVAASGNAAATRQARDKSFIAAAAKQSNRTGAQGNGHRKTPRALPKGPDQMPKFDRNRLLKQFRDLPPGDLKSI